MESLLPGLLQCLVTSVILAWIAFVLLRWQLVQVAHGHGWRWVGLAGALGLAPWLLHHWLGGSIACPILAAMLYLVSLVGLAPDDSVLHSRASAASRWHQRGLASAALGSAGGLASWLLLLR